MRSNDLIYGFTYDAPYFVSLQDKICLELGMEKGSYNHFATNMHVYERHFEMLEDIANVQI